MASWATAPVVITDYDPAWTDRGIRERDPLRPLLQPWLTDNIEHVGSTAIDADGQRCTLPGAISRG